MNEYKQELCHFDRERLADQFMGKFGGHNSNLSIK